MTEPAKPPVRASAGERATPPERAGDGASEDASCGGRRREVPLEDKMLCERCGKAEMFRMHAVWRCPACGYKTDCCGW